ncbi:MAG: phosphoenolpyruvate--protein phosphotransferase [Robiginitomaculum sp.]
MKICSFISPATGWVGPLSEAPDPVFSEKMMGDGVLLDPVSGTLCSPCDGEIIAIARTNHAVTVRADNGAEILMHIGLETVALDGAGFDMRVRVGERVKAGDMLVDFDLSFLADNAKSVLTPVVISNSDDYEIFAISEGYKTQGDVIFDVRAKTNNGAAISVDMDGPAMENPIDLPLEHGLHARPAARLAAGLKGFNARVQIIHGDKICDAKSTVGLMGLGTKHGDNIIVRASGPDAQRAADMAIKLISEGLGETPMPLTPVGANANIGAIASPKPSVALDGSAVLGGTMGAPGLVIGTVFQWKTQDFNYAENGQGAQAELNCLIKAVSEVRGKLEALAAQGVKRGAKGGAEKGAGAQADVLMAHIGLLDDPGLLEEARLLIDKNKSASHAWHKATRRNIEILKSLGDARMAERADDLLDIELQVLASLSGENAGAAPDLGAGTIVIADELLPSQFVNLASEGLGGLCLIQGGPTSHVSILAADKGVPALVALGQDISAIPNGTNVILEADRGLLHVAPSAGKITQIKAAIKKRQKNQTLAKKNAHLDCVTKDGVAIEVFANLGASGDAANAVANGAQGCGLLRSEFLFLGRATPPSEDEQLSMYQTIADALDGRPLVIRTMDIGGDKPVPFVHIPDEDNPALGLRGIRISLRREDLFLAQLRAILRVKSSGPVHIMLPMVVERDEFMAARKMVEKASKQLGLKGKRSLGIMIETPASAVLADQLAKDVDFFSVGTNDLSQYVLAIDRGNSGLAASIDALHPAVLRMISMASKAARDNKIWMGVCGGAASDLVAAPILIGLGVTELSSTIARLPELKAFLRTVTMKDCEAAASHALTLTNAKDIREYVRQKWPHLADWT